MIIEEAGERTFVSINNEEESINNEEESINNEEEVEVATGLEELVLKMKLDTFELGINSAYLGASSTCPRQRLLTPLDALAYLEGVDVTADGDLLRPPSIFRRDGDSTPGNVDYLLCGILRNWCIPYLFRDPSLLKEFLPSFLGTNISRKLTTRRVYRTCEASIQSLLWAFNNNPEELYHEIYAKLDRSKVLEARPAVSGASSATKNAEFLFAVEKGIRSRGPKFEPGYLSSACRQLDIILRGVSKLSRSRRRFYQNCEEVGDAISDAFWMIDNSLEGPASTSGVSSYRLKRELLEKASLMLRELIALED